MVTAWGILTPVASENGRIMGRVLCQVLEDVEWACKACKQGMGAAAGTRSEKEEEVASLQVEGSWPRSVLGLLRTYRKIGTMSSCPSQ
jgi:hypothetical protein